MDWKKTKNQIILILLILNLSLLGLYLKKEKDLSPYKNPEATIKNLEENLKEKGIKLETEIPTHPVKEKPLIVKYQEENIKTINEKYFGGTGDIDIRENITTISKGQEEITIINNRRFLYENYKKENKKEKNTKEKALAFLEEKKIDTSDMLLSKITEEKTATTYEYLKTYKDKILETSYLRLTLEGGTVTKMDSLWIEVIQEEKDKIQIEPAYKALFALTNTDENKGKTIEEIKVCYYFNPEEQGLLEDNTKAEQGRAIPAWRIKFTDGTIKILDNF